MADKPVAPPDTVPAEGGSYLRDPLTGALTRQPLPEAGSPADEPEESPE